MACLRCAERDVRAQAAGPFLRCGRTDSDRKVRRVPMDDRWRIRPEALAEMIGEDRAAGLKPWLVVAAAGTTDTGAIDPLNELADVAERERCWYRVDAAYGGYFLLTDHGKAAMRGIGRADSVVLDPHKTLFLPYGCGMVITRDAGRLAATNTYTGHHMQDALRDTGEVSPADLSPELSRHFRALRMWLPLVLLGTKPFRAALDEKLLLARYFRMEGARLGFEVGPDPELSVVTYRWAPEGLGLDATNALNKAIIQGAQRDGRIFLSSTMLDGRYTLRMAAVTHRTHRRTIDLALTVLREQVGALG